MTKNNKHIGSTLDAFLEEEGIVVSPRETSLKETDAVGELAQIRHTLDSRYDDIKSGKVKMIPGDVALAQLRQRNAKRRSIRDDE